MVVKYQTLMRWALILVVKHSFITFNAHTVGKQINTRIVYLSKVEQISLKLNLYKL